MTSVLAYSKKKKMFLKGNPFGKETKQENSTAYVCNVKKKKWKITKIFLKLRVWVVGLSCSVLTVPLACRIPTLITKLSPSTQDTAWGSREPTPPLFFPIFLVKIAALRTSTRLGASSLEAQDYEALSSGSGWR